MHRLSFLSSDINRLYNVDAGKKTERLASEGSNSDYNTSLNAVKLQNEILYTMHCNALHCTVLHLPVQCTIILHCSSSNYYYTLTVGSSTLMNQCTSPLHWSSLLYYQSQIS